MNDTQYFFVSWEELHRDTRALACRLLATAQSSNSPWKGIIAVTRGGMVPAAIIARELAIHVVETLGIISYDEQKQGTLKVVKDFNVELVGDGKDWLVIDDLVDTGKTYAAIRDILPQAHFATVYAKPQGKPFVDTFVTEVSQNTWIHLPWDLGLEVTKPLIKR